MRVGVISTSPSVFSGIHGHGDEYAKPDLSTSLRTSE